MYTELIDGSIQSRNQNARIVHLEDIGYESCDHERYTSLFQYGESIRNHFAVNGSVKGYRGEFYMNILWVDIDNADVSLALQSSKDFVKKLVSEYLVDPSQVYICFSGKKGFHIGIHSSLFGGFAPSPDLPARVKRLVASLTEGIPSVDHGIYNNNRAFRAINSRHPDSGLYKSGLRYEDFMAQDIEEISFYAEVPNPTFRFSAEVNPARPNKRLIEAWEYACYTDDYSHEVGSDRKKEDGGLFSPPTEGDRNNKLFKQACALFDKSQFKFYDIVQILSGINDAGTNPLDYKELYNITRSAQQRTQVKAEAGDGVKTWFALHEQIPDILNALDEKSGTYDLAFDEFNDLIKGDLKGKLIVLAGQGGTKKSLYAQEIMFRNARNGMRGIYNNQEMSRTQFLKRSINMYRDGHAPKKLWDEFKELYASDREEATKKVQEMLKDDFSKRIIVDYKLASNAAHYRSIVEQVENAYGKIDMFVVDGLSMMADSGGEKDSAEKHTRELKYLANELNIPIVALVHVTKNIPRHTRDLTPYLRGSGKIYDNADIFISCSLVVDTERTSNDDVVYRTDVGYLRLFDKRDSGETVNVVYNFDPNTLSMSSSHIDPASIEIKLKNRYLNADKF